MTAVDAPVQSSLPKHVPLNLSDAKSLDSLGPLAALLGKWSGTGWNMIAVPNGNGGFQLLVNEIDETITFTAIEALVPNRSNGGGTMLLAGVSYDIKVTDATEGPNFGNLLHAENGMWLWPTNLAPKVTDTTATDEIFTPKTVVRIATVPHGNSLVAIGPFSKFKGAPKIPNISGLPTPVTGAPNGYSEVYRGKRGDFDPQQPNSFLIDQNKKADIVSTLALSVTTSDDVDGGIVNIPFIRQYADAKALESTFWVETVKDATTGELSQQLQYSQTVDIYFHKHFDLTPGLIKWPHVTVNTLAFVSEPVLTIA
jgi:hypothetical protein